MKEFNVLIFDINSNKPKFFNIIPYFVERYELLSKAKTKSKPKTFEEFKRFIKDYGMYQFWSRCEYEILVDGVPPYNDPTKMDVYDQITANLDLITKLVIDSIIK